MQKQIASNLYKVLALSLITMLACNKMEDIHSTYIEDGELIYASKPFEADYAAGNNRLRLDFILRNAANVDQCIIKWDSGESSKTVNLSPKLPEDTIQILIEGLEEKSHVFDIHTLDAAGNSSVPIQIVGSAYGEKFQASLSPHIISSMEGGTSIDSVLITWGLPVGNLTGMKLFYTSTAGQEVVVAVGAEEEYSVIRDWKPLSTLRYESYYIPEPGAIDTFIALNEVELPDRIEFEGANLDKTSWEIVEFSSEEGTGEGPPNGLVTSAIDGDVNTFWHSAWSSQQPPYPHHFTVDMKQEAVVSGITCHRRQGDGRGQTAFEILTSIDGVSFTSQGSFSYDANADNQSYTLNFPVARYIKYIATAGPNFFAFLGELDVEGQYVPNTKLDNSNWTIVDFSSEESTGEGPPNGLAGSAIDGDIGTYWHSAWSSQQPPYPHHITIDLGEVHKVGKVECFRRQGDGRGQNKFRIETSLNNVDWIDQGQFDFDSNADLGQFAILSFIPEARYVRYTATAGSNFFAFLAEISIYGE